MKIECSVLSCLFTKKRKKMLQKKETFLFMIAILNSETLKTKNEDHTPQMWGAAVDGASRTLRDAVVVDVFLFV